MTILVYMRYSQFRVSYGNKIKELNKDLKLTKSQKEEIESRLGGDYKKENEQVKGLLRELEQSRKERQGEVVKRMEAEKEIDLSKEKIMQVQKRVEDWKRMQESAINDSKDLIMNFGNDLINKIHKTHMEEEDRTRNFFEENVKSIENNVNTLHREIGGIDSRIIDFRKKVSQAITSSQKKAAAESATVKVSSEQKQQPTKAKDNASQTKSDNNNGQVGQDQQKVEVDVAEVEAPKSVKLDKIALKALKDVVSLAEASGLEHMKDYIVANELEGDNAKYMLCDLFLFIGDVCYVVDFKADRFFVDYHSQLKEGKEKEATSTLKSRFDKYLSYIGNPKYLSLVNKFIEIMNIEPGDLKLVCALKSYDDLRVVEKIGYNPKLDELNIELMDVNGVNDLIL